MKAIDFSHWYKYGKELIKEIEDTILPRNSIAIWYLGQASIVIKGTDRIIYLDPFLSDLVDEKGISRRQFPPPFRAEEITHVDLVLCSHNHLDHMDLPSLRSIALSSPNASFIVPQPYIDLLRNGGIDFSRIIGAQAWKSIFFTTLSITPIPAAHEEYERDNLGNYLCLGYIIFFPEVTVYFAGDTVETEDLAETLKRFNIDVAFLPINGADWHRRRKGTIGNMNAREAANISAESDIDLVIPIHFDLFKGNSENPSHFVDYMLDYYPNKKFHIMRLGERFIYMK